MLRTAERIFIAYSHADLKLARQIHKKLLRLRPNAPPESTFLDQESLTPGTRVTPEEVEGRLREADLVVVLCGVDTASRPIVCEEVEIGLERMAQQQAQILPIILKSGVALPPGLDYQVQAIFLTVLFPEIRWQKISTFAASALFLLLLLAVLARASWAMWIAPPEGWTIIELSESGFDQAVLVRAENGSETIRTLRRYIVRGTFAEEVDNTNHLFLEFDLSGRLTGAFATTMDDAGSFRDRREIERYGGLGTLEAATTDLVGELPQGDAIWARLTTDASRCPLVSWGDGLGDLLEILSREIRPLEERHVKPFRLNSATVLVVIPDTSFQSSLFVRIHNLEIQKTSAVAFMPKGILAIAKRTTSPDSLFAVKADTRWEDEGSEGGLFRSDDGDASWSKLDLGEASGDFQLSDVTAGLGSSPRIAVSYAEGEGGIYGVLISDDEGRNWRSLRTGLAGGTVQKINLVGVAGDSSIVIALPGGRLARWRAFSFSERFVGIGKVQL